MAPVAMVLASNAMASLPRDRFSAMIPEPITVAKRKKAPSPSAARRLASVGRSTKGGHRVPSAPDLGQPVVQAHRVDASDGQRQEWADTVPQTAWQARLICRWRERST